ncbi:uncharacterized protein P884DRAFT_283930 [Thermothelomyces heterothallicus CBS 202.75]|uniref:uncharacterized protein n=1 Tax=Thermothelomyces heterothallicus CBS 202.75 TaxID=1149848 RepID=UPI003742F97F
MQGLVKTALAAALVASVAAQPHNHGHRHLHAKKHNHLQMEKRDTVIVTKVVEGPTVTEYVMGNGKKVDAAEAKKGLEKGDFIVMGETKPTFSAPPPVVSTSVASLPHGGQFYEKTTSVAPSSTSSAAPKPSTSSAPAPEPELPTGLDADFPSGKVPCDKVPTEYGAVEIPWVGTNGWTTLAKFGKWVKGAAVDNIESPTDGTCEPGMMCSYACPPGYEKTQWPEEQGATGQSVGGLWCNEDGFLELTRPNVTKICEPGAGGVYVVNKLPGTAAVCRTDYPGNEAMVIPLETSPGGKYPLTNPDSATYYWWKGQPTTAQYYVNPLDVEVEEACTWQSKKYPDSAGNWAPTNIGVGKSLSGETFISIFPNSPTSSAVLDFNIKIEGDGISGECWLKNGEYYGSSSGCTVGLKAGGTANIVFYK